MGVEGKCWFLSSGKEGYLLSHPQVVQEGGGCHRLGRRVFVWYQVMRKALGCGCRRRRKVLAVTGGKGTCPCQC